MSVARNRRVAAAVGRRAAPYGRKPVRSAAGFLHKINRAAIGGPQPGGGEGPQLASARAVLRRLRPEFVILNFEFAASLKPQQPAAASWRRVASSRPIGPLVQARPLGCGLAASQIDPARGRAGRSVAVVPVRQDRAGRSLRPAEARSSLSSQACPPQVAARTPNPKSNRSCSLTASQVILNFEC